MNSVFVVYCQDAAFFLSASEMASSPAQGSSIMEGVQYSSAGMSDDLDCGYKNGQQDKMFENKLSVMSATKKIYLQSTALQELLSSTMFYSWFYHYNRKSIIAFS